MKNRRSLEPMKFPLGNDSCAIIFRNTTVGDDDDDDDDDFISL